MENKFTFRPAKREDTPLILEFIKGIAAYEKMSDEVVGDVKLLEEELFDKHHAEVIFVMDDETGKEAGFALFFHNFSTFVGRSGLYLEDLFVWPDQRKKGYGKALLEELGRIARKRNCGRLELCCLDWNQPSIDFYKSLGAIAMDEWTNYRFAGEALENLGK